ncbi:ABC transporter ATP-binding protein [Erysipelotrichaceae bacterium OttesenSCG-928-M19]|nr:ABC transporter ATP-binding protein [Erysipelotrichaceae bacterium OttesenSCG-928-M19]
MENVIEMLEITKEFPGIKAVDNVTFEVKKQEIHALLGENGAGKSTLMSILFGLYQPEAGLIKVKGKEVKITNPNIANDLGIGMVHQHFKLIDDFSVVENIILGYEPVNKFVLDLDTARHKVIELSEKYQLNVDVDAKIEDISVGMQQRVEILKMLYRDNDILIFDEPTAVLTPQEVKELMKIMKNLINEGKSIILITHKLKEIKMVADRCKILRKGKKIGCVEVAKTTESEMASMMVGREVNFNVEKEAKKAGDVVLEIKNLVIEHKKKYNVVNDISFKVRKGEVYGIAGIEGNGQTELVYGITGLVKVKSGSIYFNDQDITNMPIKKRFDIGLSHVPEDRHKHGLVLDFTLAENIVLHSYDKKPYQENGIINKKEVDQYANRLIKEFDIRSSLGSKTIVRQMSGGNQQKIIIAREISLAPDLLLVVQPTRGLDVGAIEYIHQRIIAQRNDDKAILLVSLELDEILSLTDRIGVMYQGQLMGEVKTYETNENEIGLMMAGLNKKESDLNE